MIHNTRSGQALNLSAGAHGSGQATVLVLLLALMGLTVGLSAASRSLSDLKQVSQVDFGTKAFAAAEAGLSYALSLDPASQTGTCSTPGIIPYTAIDLRSAGIKDNITYSVCAAAATTAETPLIATDDVAQFALNSVRSNTKSFNIFWQQGVSDPPSLEVSVLDKDNVLRRFAFNPSGSARTNGFAAGYTYPSAECSSNCAAAGYTHCSGDTAISFIAQDKLIRIKPLYVATRILLCALDVGKSRVDMPTDYYTVTATATTINGTVRRLQAVRSPAALPALFDYVLFSGGDIVKN